MAERGGDDHLGITGLDLLHQKGGLFDIHDGRKEFPVGLRLDGRAFKGLQQSVDADAFVIGLRINGPPELLCNLHDLVLEQRRPFHREPEQAFDMCRINGIQQVTDIFRPDARRQTEHNTVGPPSQCRHWNRAGR